MRDETCIKNRHKCDEQLPLTVISLVGKHCHSCGEATWLGATPSLPQTAYGLQHR
jgi:hypothetical protein